ncbi:hypothetical protein [Methanobrevibacter sp.]|uniref:hypothetical protein n=1 Tax=Methanobrevibacter sp. TaxID=66852 RepID=UPI0025D17241|nr:hypothetical protein [Methanobrevibacter sp.]
MIPYVSAENVTIDNSMSIQDAVNTVSDNDTIFLSPGTYVESGIKIDKNITLQGMGNADEIIIDGDHKNTIILVNSVSQVKFFNLTFINGKSPDFGGAIHSELGGQIYVDSCNFINNSARQNGGAIDIAGEQHRVKWQVFTNYGFLNATNCNFINNTAYHDGGALATYWGNSYVYNSVFKNNYADRDGGSVRVGVYSTTLTENCTFDNNTAKEWGGALYNWPGELTVNNCVISNNYAGRQGGAMITSGPLTVTNSKIINNSADKKGGVIYIAEETPHIPSTVIFENNYIEGNTAKVGSLVYADETTATGTNFNNNHWDIDSSSDDWNKAFITNNLIDSPTTFLDENGNAYTVTPKENPTPSENNTHVPEEKTNHTEIPESMNDTNSTIPENTNNTQTNTTTQENENNDVVNDNTNTLDEIIEEIIESANVQNNSTTILDTNVGLDNAQNSESQNPESPQSNAGESNAHEIVKKDVSKQTEQSPLPYIAAILIILAIFGYGYYRNSKKE